jgi:hypothetical protein
MASPFLILKPILGLALINENIIIFSLIKAKFILNKKELACTGFFI